MLSGCRQTVEPRRLKTINFKDPHSVNKNSEGLKPPYLSHLKKHLESCEAKIHQNLEENLKDEKSLKCTNLTKTMSDREFLVSA
jgi:hypothetical protein